MKSQSQTSGSSSLLITAAAQAASRELLTAAPQRNPAIAPTSALVVSTLEQFNGRRAKPPSKGRRFIARHRWFELHDPWLELNAQWLELRAQWLELGAQWLEPDHRRRSVSGQPASHPLAAGLRVANLNLGGHCHG